MMPHFSRPNMPRAKARLTTALTLSTAELMLRQPHAVNDYRRARLAVQGCESLHVGAGQTGALLKHFPGLSIQRGFEIGESRGVFVDKLAVQSIR